MVRLEFELKISTHFYPFCNRYLYPNTLFDKSISNMIYYRQFLLFENLRLLYRKQHFAHLLGAQCAVSDTYDFFILLVQELC